MNARWMTIAALVAVMLAGSPAVRAAPLEAYGRLPAMDMVTLSPDGSKLAYVIIQDGKQAVAVSSIDPPAFITGLKGTDQKVRELVWADDGHLLVVKSLTVDWYGVEEWSMVQDLDLAARNSVPLIGPIEGSPERRLINGHGLVFLRGYSSVDSSSVPTLYSIDVDTNRPSIVDQSLNRSRARSWVVDAQGELIAKANYDNIGQHWGLWLKLDGKWANPYTLTTPIDTPDLQGVSPDGSALIVRTLEDSGYGFRAISLKDGKASPPLDAYKHLSDLIEDPLTHRIIGGVTAGAEIDYVFFAPEDEAAWKSVLAGYPGEAVELVSWSDDRRRIVVGVTGQAHGVTYHLVDLNTHKTIGIGDAYDRIKPNDVAGVEIIAYKAEDGRTIPAYLTLPNGRPAKGLPLVVLPHGGPAARDPDGFDWWAQALASRGYAVLQPQFRGSDEFGWEFESAGFGQWGRKMQTDLSDGVKRLAAQGLIDPKRVCIVGASYGGYAALAGVTLESGVYRCAVSVSGLSDLRRFLGAHRDPKNSPGLRYWDRYMGAESPDDPVLEELSPIKHANRAAAPVLLIHGKQDSVVPFEQSQKMADALKAAGKPVEFVVLKDEDHWLSRSDTRLQMLQATVKFLETNNPPS